MKWHRRQKEHGNSVRMIISYSFSLKDPYGTVVRSTRNDRLRSVPDLKI